MDNVTLHAFLTELTTWFTFTDDQFDEAAISKVSTDSNHMFRKLVADWIVGIYDEDLNALKQNTLNFLK